MKNRKQLRLKRNVAKYYRWFRRCWYYAYIMRVRQTEREIGGELHAC